MGSVKRRSFIFYFIRFGITSIILNTHNSQIVVFFFL